MRNAVMCVAAAVILVSNATAGPAGERDFSGKWVLSTGDPSLNPEPVLNVTQDESTIRCASGGAQWSYALDGRETKYRIGAETRNSAVKWEGAALLINTLVSGKQNYVIEDRWRQDTRGSRSLTIARHVIVNGKETEGVLVYREAGVPPAAEAAPRPVLSVREPEPPADEAYTVRAGTRILLALLNTVDTKHSHEGDRVYLQTSPGDCR